VTYIIEVRHNITLLGTEGLAHANYPIKRARVRYRSPEGGLGDLTDVASREPKRLEAETKAVWE
jgi:hypothetical protein